MLQRSEQGERVSTALTRLTSNSRRLTSARLVAISGRTRLHRIAEAKRKYLMPNVNKLRCNNDLDSAFKRAR